MLKRRPTRSSGIIALMVFALGASALGVGTADPAGAASPPAVTLTGSGSTLQKAFVDQMISEFTESRTRVTIRYLGTGSDAGRQALAEGSVDFAASDAPFSTADAAKLRSPILYFPTVVAPIAIAYSLGTVAKLQLSGPTLSKIFQRQVTVWNDPVIVADNPGVTLPSTPITVVRRSDGSGTTQNLGAYLTKADPGGWKLGSGSTMNWPPDTRGAVGTVGVANLVKATAGAIGFLDFSDARAAGLPTAWIRNQLGRYVQPSPQSAAEAAKNAPVTPDLTFDPIDATGLDAYPISAPTYLVVSRIHRASATTKALRSFLAYVETTGQQSAIKVGYGPLPGDLAKRARAQVGEIEG